MYPWIRRKWLTMEKNEQVSLKCKATLIANNIHNPKVMPIALKALAALINDYDFIRKDCRETYIEMMDNTDEDRVLSSQQEFLRLYFKQFVNAEYITICLNRASQCSTQTQ